MIRQTRLHREYSDSGKNSEGFSMLAGLLIVMVVSASGLAGVRVIRNSSPKDSTPTTSAPDLQPGSTTTPNAPNYAAEQPSLTPTPNKPQTFDIADFYGKLQAGMSSNQVVELAGKQPNDCVSTGSVPPSVTCFWYDGDKSVAVHYGQTDVVQSRTKSGF